MRPIAALFIGLACAPAAATPLVVKANLLTNGGFERGSFADWSLTGNTAYSQVYNQNYDGLAAHGGTHYALLGPQGSDGILTQGFADKAGAPLTISFWLASDGGAQDAFSVSFDGKGLMSLTDAGVFGWTRYTEQVTGTGADSLSFSFRDDQDYWALDQVRVFESTPVEVEDSVIPEPPACVVLPALLLMMLAGRRRPAA